MLVTLTEAAALVSVRDPRTVKRHFGDDIIKVGVGPRVDTAALALGGPRVEASMIAEAIGTRTAKGLYSRGNGECQRAADQAALEDAQQRAEQLDQYAQIQAEFKHVEFQRGLRQAWKEGA